MATFRRTYTKRVDSDTNFERYINICINDGYKTYASGGRLYCNVQFTRKYLARVRYIDRAKAKWTTEGLAKFNGAVLAATP